MVDFGGWDMPVQYSSLLEEHHAVRKAVGLFDVSHMGEIDITGPMKTNNVRVLERAIVPGVPVRPKPVQNLLLGLAFGLGVGIGLGSSSGVQARTGLPLARPSPPRKSLT